MNKIESNIKMFSISFKKLKWKNLHDKYSAIVTIIFI